MNNIIVNLDIFIVNGCYKNKPYENSYALLMFMWYRVYSIKIFTTKNFHPGNSRFKYTSTHSACCLAWVIGETHKWYIKDIIWNL